MKIQIVLSPETPNYGELQAELSGEIMALQGSGVAITTVTAPPPENTLGFGEVLQFIIDNREEITSLIPLLTAAVQAVTEIFRRRNIAPPKPVRKKTTQQKKKAKSKKEKPPKTEPFAIILVGNHRLNFPCSPSQASNFIKKIRKDTSKKDENK
jgi:hypothetical protein